MTLGPATPRPSAPDRRARGARRSARARLVPAIALAFAAAIACAPAPARAARRLYIANDDHTDYVWSGTVEQYRDVFTSMLDFYMAQAEATAANVPDARGRFNCDGSLWVWEYERNRSAADVERLAAHVRAGDITVPLNAAVLTYGGTPAEGVLRGMYYAGRLERRWNTRFPLVLAMENQTLPGGLASLWAGAGAKYSWRGVCGCASHTAWRPRPRAMYRYLGPDGQGVAMKWNTQWNGPASLGGYAEASDPAEAVQRMNEDPDYLAEWPWDVCAAFGHGGDSLQTSTNAFVEASLANADTSQRVIVSNEVDFFEDFLAHHGGEIPSFSGSFGNEWELCQASLAAVSSAFRRSLEKLRTAEALATLASLSDPAFMTGREEARDRAFMAAGLFYEHDWTADGPVPRELRAQYQRDMLADLQAYVDPLAADALAAVASRVPARAGAERVLVFNPLSWSRTDVADLAVSAAPPLRVVDVATGQEVPSQVVATGPTVVRILAQQVPSVGYRVYEVQPVAAAPRSPSANVALPEFDNGTYGVTLGSGGAVTGIVDHRRDDEQLVGADGGTLFDLVPGSGTIAVESSGPVSTTLSVTAEASPPHVAHVTLYSGLDRIDFEDDVTGNFGGTLTYSSRFDLAGATMRHEEVGMIAEVARAADGGDYADDNARTDWLSIGHFVDLSLADRGVTLSNDGCSFFKAGASTEDALDTTTPSIDALAGMRVVEPALGFEDQGGDDHFRYRFALRSHGAYDPAEAMRFALEHQNPLVATHVAGGSGAPLPGDTLSLVSLPSKDVLLWALKPSEDGIGAGVVARVWNLADVPSDFTLAMPGRALDEARHVTHVETDLAPAALAGGRLADHLARQQMATYRLSPAPATLAAPASVPGAGLALCVGPNPLARAASGRVTFTLPAAGHARVTVLDVRGARVAVLHDGVLPAGPQSLAWDRRGVGGAPVAPGVYFVRVEAGGLRAQRRIAVLD